MRDLELIIMYTKILNEGDEVHFADGKILRRMDGVIWESILFIEEEDEINGEDEEET